MWPYLPPANEVWSKVIFLHLFVILFTVEGLVRGGGLLLGGACSRGVPALDGGMPAPGGGAWWRPPGQLLLRAVRILLECILVILYIFKISITLIRDVPII